MGEMERWTGGVAEAGRAGDELDDAHRRATGLMPPQTEVAAEKQTNAAAAANLRYVTPSMLERRELVDTLLQTNGSRTYLSLPIAQQANRRQALGWASQAAWIELDYDMLVLLTGLRGGIVVQRMCRLWNAANKGLVVLDNPLGALAFTADGEWAHCRPFAVDAPTDRPTFAAHFLAALSGGATLNEALRRGHAAGVASSLGVPCRTQTDIEAFAASAPRCFPRVSKAVPAVSRWGARVSQWSLAASISVLLALGLK